MSAATYDATSGRMVPLFLRYSIPTVLGMIAVSSASIVDAIFLGNVIGPAGVAILNLSTPIGALIFGAGTMLATGGCVTAGKLQGAGEHEQASSVFTGTLQLILLISTILCLISYLALDHLVLALGARGSLIPLLHDYLSWMLLFSPGILLAYGLCVFARLDGNPNRASLALLLSSVAHVFLDWLFVVRWGWGVSGAAIATGLAYTSVVILLLPYFLNGRSTLRFTRRWSWAGMVRSIRNGTSEFANEISVGITTLVFNWILMSRLGPDGVAAYAIVEFVVLFTLLFTRGVCESVEPIISKNFGARRPERMAGFFRLAATAVVTTSAAVACLLMFSPASVVGIFIGDSSQPAFALALEVIAYFWLACLFNGMNVIFVSYLVAVHQPATALVISLTRSLFLPALLVLTLPALIGREGLFLAIPLAELLTFVLAATCVMKLRPSVVIALDSLSLH